MPIENLTQSEIKELLSYNSDTGIFTWLKHRINSLIDSPANYINNCGYVIIRIEGRAFVAHRLAWLYMTGKWPSLSVDHINCIRSDNRWCNLREASKSENQRNRNVTKSSKSQLKGAYKKGSKYVSYICLGTFDTPEEASAMYAKAAKIFHGEFANYEKNIS